MAIDAALEIVHFPIEQRHSTEWYKVVEVLVGDAPFLVFPSVRLGISGTHTLILEEFLQERSIAFTPERLPRSLGRTGPPLLNETYRITGMGTVKCNIHDKTISRPYEQSHDYGIGPDPGFEGMIQRALPEGWTLL
jgi:hypothetical protein